MNLPDLYTRVVAKRPDLAVPGLCLIQGKKKPYWTLSGNYLWERAARAMIHEHWLECLPVGAGLVRFSDRSYHKWTIETPDDPQRANHAWSFDALAAFYLDIDSMYWHQQV